MVKLLLLLFSVASIRNSYCLSLPSNFNEADVRKVTEKLIALSKNNKLEITSECEQQLSLFTENLRTSEDGMWALKMIDASAKVPAGLLTGNMAMLGNYDECLAIEATTNDVKAEYCLVGLSGTTTAENLTALTLLHQNRNEEYRKVNDNDDIEIQVALLPSIAFCIPHKCTIPDVRMILHLLIPKVSFSVTCQTKDDLHKPLDTGAILTICYFGLFILLMTLSTLYDVLHDKKTKSHPLLVAFSTYTNSKRLFRVSKNSNEFSCLHGLKFISMMWVIIGHVFSSVLIEPITNFADASQYILTTKSMVFVNAVYSVDTFFVITGFLVVFSFMKSMHQGHKFNIIIFYLHRYLRLVPALIPVILASIFLIKYLGSGPFYPQSVQYSQACSKYWWSTLLFIQNYVNVNSGMCIGQTWYLNVDWQLYLIAPVFLLFLPKRPIIGLSLMLCGTIGAMVCSFIITWNYKLAGLMNNFHTNGADFMGKYYYITHTRAATWFIGAFLGYIMGKIKFQLNINSIRLPKLLVILNWLIVLTTLPVCIFAGADNLTSEEYNAYSNAFYNTFARPAWGICIAWIIFSCGQGYGGLINTFLSLPLFQVLSRFTYSMFLLHLTPLSLIMLAQKQPAYYSLFNVAYSFWGIFALTLGLAVFWVLAFESPIPIIENYLLGKIRRKSTDKQQINSDTNTKPAIISKSHIPHSIKTES